MMKDNNNVSCTTCNTRYLANKQNEIDKNIKSNDFLNCQSCGILLSKIPDNIHTYYCLNCWDKGKFVLEDITLKEMKANNLMFLKENGYSEKEIKLTNKKLKGLLRWKKH